MINIYHIKSVSRVSNVLKILILSDKKNGIQKMQYSKKKFTSHQ